MTVGEELSVEWRAFLATSKPTMRQMTDWISVKCAELGLDYFHTAAFLIQVENPGIPKSEPERGN